MSLLGGLVAYWTLAESSSTRYSHNDLNNLADNATVTGADGKVHATSSQFTAANSEYLSIADNADLSTGDIDFTVAAWVYFDTKPSSAVIAAKYNSSSVREHLLLYEGGATDRIGFQVYNSAGGAITASTPRATISPSTATWYFVVAWHDSVANVVTIEANNSNQASVATTDIPADTAALFRIGSIDGLDSFFDGRIGPVSFWKRLLSSDERNRLWNNGYGLAYPFELPLRRERFRRRREPGLILSQRAA